MIKELSIKNFKCFLDSVIKFNNLTLFAGTNAVGKSTVIQSLLLIRSTIDKYNNINTSHNNHIALNDNYCLELGNSSEVLSTNADDEEIKFVIKTQENSYEFNYKANRYEKEIFLSFEEDSSNIKHEHNSDCSIMNEEFHYLNAERVGPRAIQSMSNQKYSNTGSRGEYTAFVISKLLDLKIEESRRIKSEEYTVPTLNKQVEYWLDYIIPGIEIKPNVYSNINVVGMTLKRKYSGTEFLNPNNIGFGISYVLPIIVSGLIAKKGSVLIVENPEAHLHPSGQSKIAQFLSQIAEAGVQVIIETHSEHVINGVRLAALKKIIDNEKITINFLSLASSYKDINIENININEKAELSNWPKGFFDQEEQDLKELFLLKKGLRK